uniref:Uncharacterized protein n=1 Tax=Oryza sativa subsp. japonica TaxID=39947 RepID=Q2QPY7_ORYSJ|nr:hypothetical protein LOC_Os12g32840 [Oryza sativa Japonica Group]
MHPFPGEPEYEFLSSHLEQIEGVQERLFGEARRLKHQVCHAVLVGHTLVASAKHHRRKGVHGPRRRWLALWKNCTGRGVRVD